MSTRANAGGLFSISVFGFKHVTLKISNLFHFLFVHIIYEI